MPTLVVLVMLVVSSLMGGVLPQGDKLPAPDPQAGVSERCMTFEPGEPFPHFFESGREFIECVTVDGVTAAFSNSSPVQIALKVSGQSWQEMDDYGYQFQIEQWRDGDEIFVAIYREIQPVSKAIPNPYEETIRLDGDFEAGSYTVRVNNYALEIAVPDAPPPGDDARPPYDDDFPPARPERSYAIINYVDVVVRDAYPARIALHVTGYYPDGCAFPVQIEQRREGNWVYVEIYRFVEVDMVCPDFRTPVNEYIRLDGGFERGRYIIQVNDYVTEVSVPFPPPPPPPPPEPIRSYAVIEYAEVLLNDYSVYPSRLTLHVTGYYGSGCQGSLQIDQSRRGNWVSVEIYQLVDPMIMCPEMLVLLDEYIPLEGGFEYGTYTIQVNNYQLWYTFPPVYYDEPLPPDTPVMPYDGEFQRYNAVIENVEVLTLESYPYQLHLHVTGYQEGGCEPSFQMDQHREGNTVTVEIFRLVNPLVMCDARPTLIDETIPIEGGFESGTYTIRVNGYTVNITL